ncbi:sushi, von Willebrand factor type A, EGF and pentraxin domain-containing protein 1-like [Dermochelys coriacea]|uniref:sushi, von Willebrand factor type A, EGF and pentraxin domain-containing protein 1-like n=1 Tax=Dermochelys coriacea TaxID=27794 RepID=UPI001CA9500D|nr:sushi, von Willebrand factor type A, EGF and pentraxin domain-containing protein 1-like [Dermochelys coriacea]
MKIWLKLFILATWLPILFAESCGDSPKVDNSIASSWGADEGKQVTYTCANGYSLFGEKNLYCTSSQKWHAPPPICKAVSSRESEPDEEEEESEALVTEKITQTISTAVKSQSLYAAVCEDVRKMAESLSCGMNWIETKSMLEMEKLRLEKLKFQLEGRQGNQLLYAKETCDCGVPPRFTFAELKEEYRNQNKFAVKSKVEYNCRPGYTKVQPKLYLWCTLYSQWSDTREFCKAKSCPHPGEPENGRLVILTDLMFGATVNFVCEEGYRLIGDAERKCVLEGSQVTWDKEIPYCQVIPCQPPPEIHHGTHTGTSMEEFNYGTSVTYQCDTVERGQVPFSLIGEPSIHCTSMDNVNGDWSGPAPECKVIRCEQPKVDHGKQMTGYSPVYTYRASILFECEHRYTLKGSDILKCNENSRWDPQLPVCERSSCDDPPYIRNTFRDHSNSNLFPAGTVVNYNCVGGYELIPGISSANVTCQKDFTWSEPEEFCQKIRCPDPNITNGRARPRQAIYEYEDMISIECEPGNALKDNYGLIKCERNRAWHPALPICEPACEPPARISNGRDDRGWKEVFPVGSSVLYSCNRGWSLVGVSSIRCIAVDGGTPRWHPPTPECKACEPPARISNGRDDRGWKEVFPVGSSVLYSCNRGWSLIGVSSIRCIAVDGGTPHWHPPAPECKACEPPARISNGRDDRGRKEVFPVGSSVLYSCNRGWSLVGVSSIRCIAVDGGTPRWHPPTPECKACEPPARISNGRDDRGWKEVFPVGSSVLYSCNRGWSLVGVSSIRCIAVDGGTPHWHPPAPECKACEPPARISNGRDDRGWKEVFPVGSSVLYSCNLGWSLIGVSSIRCIAVDGGTPRWHPPAPECKACEPPARISNGRDDRGWKEVFPVGSSVLYSCNLGWSLIGVSSIRCIAVDGGTPRWHPPAPECKACEPPARISNGWDDRGRKEVFPLGSSVLYSCNRGWSLVGVSSIRCIAVDGGTPRWHPPAPECKVRCPKPDVQNEGMVNALDEKAWYNINESITFKCSPGYQFSDLWYQSTTDTLNITCSADGTWTVLPVCEKQLNSPLCNMVRESIKFLHCDVSLTELRTLLEAQKLYLEIQKLKRDLQKYNEYCRAQTPTSPCLVPLGGPGWGLCCTMRRVRSGCSPARTALSPPFSENSPGTMMSLPSGWTLWLLGTLVLMLLPGGALSHCVDPPDIPNAVRKTNVGTLIPAGMVVKYGCRPGYELIAGIRQGHVTCLQNSTWSSAPNFCQKIRCPAPDVNNGTQAPMPRPGEETYAFGDSVTIECDFGHGIKGSINGNAQIHCRHDGTWDPAVPVCEPVCAQPPNISHGQHSDWSKRVFFVGSSVTYKCDKGFSFVGKTSIQCIAGDEVTPTWSEPTPQCEEIRCPAPDVNNGTQAPMPRPGEETYAFGDSVTIECDFGHGIKGSINGNAQIHCRHDGTWDPAVPVCEPVCAQPPNISHGQHSDWNKRVFVVGSSVTYKCDRGFSLVGKTSIQCIAGGEVTPTWSEPTPQCEETQCPVPHTQHGSQKSPLPHNYTYGTSVMFQCDPGYLLRGAERIQCQADGKWYPQQPVCDLGRCSYPPALAYADRSNHREFLVGTVVTYSCRPGYKRIPGVSPHLTCLTNFTWPKVSELCQKISCSKPVVENGKQIYPVKTEYTYANRIVFQCDPGYILRGSEGIVCRSDGMWHPPVPFCDKTCGRPPPIMNGLHDGGMKEYFPYESQVTYSCGDGLSLIGESSIYCTSDGVNMMWSGPAPQCKVVRCPRPEVENGRMAPTRRAFTYGVTVRVSCKEGFLLHGSRESQCQDDNTWNPPVPSCRPVQCPKPDVQNGRMVNALDEKMWYNINERIPFKCFPGYHFSDDWYLPTTDSFSIICSANGNWTALPKCKKQSNTEECSGVRESKEFLHCDVPLTELRTLLELKKLYLEIQKLKREIKKL